MKILLILSLSIFFSSVSSQSVNGIPLEDLDVDYFMIIGTSNFSGTKMRIMFDFGQKVGFTTKNMIVKDKNGKNLQLESMVDALNFVSKYGYRFQNWTSEVKGRSLYYGVLVKKSENLNVNKTEKTIPKEPKVDYESNENLQNYSGPKPELTFKEKHDIKVAAFNNAAKKVGEGINNLFKSNKDSVDAKPKNNVHQEEDTKKAEVPQKEKVACSLCKETGKIENVCKKDHCQNGKVYVMCNTCNGKYSNYNSTCPKCDGIGCEYCDYDGQACNKCEKGQKQEPHNECNGTGIITTTCPDCNGKGFLIK